MRKILILAAMLSIVLFSYGTSQAASSSIDNIPGGAGIAYFQAGGGWETYINIQGLNSTYYRIVHIALWDGNSAKLWDWNVCLTPLDNVGIVLSGGSSTGQVRISDYSDTPAGMNTVPAVGTGYITTTSGTTSSGIAYGYMTAVDTGLSATSCAAALATVPGYTGAYYIPIDDIFMRSAILTTSEAFAMNNPMLQDFLNIPSVNETSGNTTNFYDHIGLAVASCSNLDGNVAAGTVYGSLDDPNGANLDWFELLITRNDVTRILTLGGADACTFLNALGSSNFYYWGRYNESTAAGTNTNLITVAPDKSRAPGTSRWNHLSAATSQLMYNDDEVANSTNVSCTVEVCFTPFGSGFNELNPGLNSAGEARLYIPFPIFGFTYTYTSAYADLYPLVKEYMYTYSQPPLAVLTTHPQ